SLAHPPPSTALSSCSSPHSSLPSFPTRRSSDLFDAKHEGHHVVIDVEEADVQGGFGAHRISPWWVIQWWTAFRSAFSCLMCSPPCPHFSHSQVQVWMRGHHFSRRILMLGMFAICS